MASPEEFLTAKPLSFQRKIKPNMSLFRDDVFRCAFPKRESVSGERDSRVMDLSKLEPFEDGSFNPPPKHD